MGSYYVLKGHPAAIQGDHLDRVHSDQMVLEMIKGGGWSGRALAQRRPRVSKLGLKGLSNYQYNKTAVEAARREARGLNKWITLMTCLLKK
jgi:hypothetical protein